MSNEVTNVTDLAAILKNQKDQEHRLNLALAMIDQQAKLIEKLTAEQEEFRAEATSMVETLALDLWAENGVAAVASHALDIAKEARTLAQQAHNREQYTRDCISAVHEHVANITAALDSKGLVDIGEVTVSLPGAQPVYASGKTCTLHIVPKTLQ